MKKQWLAALIVGFGLLGSLAFAQARENGEASAAVQEAETLTQGQPIAFPHDIHAGVRQIDCQYCHFSAERSTAAGVPPVATCMGCHSYVSGTANPQEIERLRGYWERSEPIPWNRIYKLPDHVQFPHMRHIAAQVDCTECHGPVTEIGVIQEVAQPLTMGWCLNCHIQQGASRDCTVCHY
jgi:hypothetical protein